MNDNYDRYIVKQKYYGKFLYESFICCTATIKEASMITDFFNTKYKDLPTEFYYYKNSKYADDYEKILDDLDFTYNFEYLEV